MMYPGLTKLSNTIGPPFSKHVFRATSSGALSHGLACVHVAWADPSDAVAIKRTAVITARERKRSVFVRRIVNLFSLWLG
jgi:hypothetical protein